MELSLQEIDKISKTPLNFVVGKERSGTTLLQVMLNAHANIIAPPESRFIVLLYYRYGKTQVWTEEIIIYFCDDLFKEDLFRNFWGIDKKELVATLYSAKDQLTFSLVCKIIFRVSSPGKKEVTVFIDKNPVYYYFLPELNKIFPEAKYIHLVRDYRANLVSHRRVFTFKNAADIAYRWLKVNKLIEEAKSQSSKNYFTLTYESLVSKPQQSMEDVCRFLGLPFDINMVQNHQSGMFSKFNSNKDTGFQKIHENVFNPIAPSLINNWEGKISANELKKVEAIAGKFGETHYGYLPVNPIEKTEETPKVSALTDLKYNGMKTFYRKALANFGLYYTIKRYLWRNI
jgi:hypothetical protein